LYCFSDLYCLTAFTSLSVVTAAAAEAEDDINEVDGLFNRLGVRDDASSTGFWAALGSSDSEFSDTEHGSSSLSISAGKRNYSVRIRLHSLMCFNAFVKVTYVFYLNVFFFKFCLSSSFLLYCTLWCLLTSSVQ